MRSLKWLANIDDYAGLRQTFMIDERGTTTNSRKLFKIIRSQKTTREYRNEQDIFAQGDAADAIFYIQKGSVKLTVVSKRGKKAVIALLGRGDFFGEGCLAKQLVRRSTATTIHESTIASVAKAVMLRIIHQNPVFAKLFISHLVARMVRIEENYADQILNSSEKRLARILLTLANGAKDGRNKTVIPGMIQANLAQMVGTTRSRINHFMNKFRKKGFIHYNGGLTVNRNLLIAILHD